MYLEIQNLIYQAEAQYLPSQETAKFKKYTLSLKLRLAVYELFRDREIIIFQEIADKISTDFPQETRANLERVLKDWLLIVRYCAMAMLLNDTTFLRHRLLEWLTDLVQVQQRRTIDRKIYELLQIQLQQLFTSEQMALIAPFLEQANHTFSQDNLAHLAG
ncbi:phycobilisome protein [Gloeocapsopsis sp. IPPAS B-1203]|uniref:phycobilisome protein n=1 Tax=Gloeocapsopsis sp. IPPAS B-1203 TaxID=2049454 RepID=UPI000C1A3539|nr:phycobilisome protein [Gloeocapsopsis sp. IPPAS B-1203]PIG94688.1 phycobilisome protein [Gloeocapsopsis sp. IPPAS B-1203]